MLIALNIGQAELHLLELEGSFTLKQIAQGLQAILGWVGLLSVHVLQDLRLVDEVRANLDQLFFHAFHVLQYAVVDDVDTEVITDVYLFLLLVNLNMVRAAHQLE